MIAFFQSLLTSWRIRNAEIDSDSKCPSCGHRHGKLKCAEVETGKEKTWMVQHECYVCHAVWFEPTIVKPELWIPNELKQSLPPRPS